MSMNRTFENVTEGVAQSVARCARRLGAGWAAVILGVLATLLVAAGSGIPSMWGDEAASVMSAQRPLATLWPVLARVDAVHGVYYVLLHFWIEVFGSSAFSVRFPSALAIGFATSGLVLLANRLGGLRLGVVAGLVFMIIPRATYMGAEARSYALSATIAVWLTLLLVVMIHRGYQSHQPRNRRRARILTVAGWVLYAVGLTTGISIFLYLAFLAVAHMAIVLLLRSTRTTMLAWTISAAAAGGMIVPFVLDVIAQREQVAFLANRPRVGAWQILVEQWMGNLGFAVIAWGIIAFGIFWGIRQTRGTHGSDAHRNGAPRRARHRFPPILMVGLSWLVISQALMLALTLVTPALALLLSFAVVSLTRIRHREWIAVVLVLALATASLMTYVGQRTPFAKDNGIDFAQVSATIGEQSSPGDAIVFDPTIRPSQRPRLALHLYPEGFTKVTDVLLSHPYDTRSWLWDTQHSITDSAQYLAGYSRIWVVEADYRSMWALAELEAQGFVVVQVIPENHCVIYELERL